MQNFGTTITIAARSTLLRIQFIEPHQVKVIGNCILLPSRYVSVLNSVRNSCFRRVDISYSVLSPLSIVHFSKKGRANGRL
ncbi:hypothetical protein I7I48_03240 [Histoplasma ohiense]|nr:hypothetical protein I7I48_03240 [Histoplasma ohiense (nom. inval.)]